jgi:hypothetical protein
LGFLLCASFSCGERDYRKELVRAIEQTISSKVLIITEEIRFSSPTFLMEMYDISELTIQKPASFRLVKLEEEREEFIIVDASAWQRKQLEWNEVDSMPLLSDIDRLLTFVHGLSDAEDIIALKDTTPGTLRFGFDNPALGKSAIARVSQNNSTMPRSGAVLADVFHDAVGVGIITVRDGRLSQVEIGVHGPNVESYTILQFDYPSEVTIESPNLRNTR